MNDNNNGKVTDLDLIEFNLKSVGIDPTIPENVLDLLDLMPKVQEAGLDDGGNERVTMRIAAELLQRIRSIQSINEKEEKGEPLSAMDKLQRYYTMTGPPKAHGPTPSLERKNDKQPLDRINEHYKRNKP